MLDLIKLFNKYASEDGDKDHLSKKEGKALLQKEFCNFIDETANKEVVEEIMTSLDFNSDGKMDFQEFMSLIESTIKKQNNVYPRREVHVGPRQTVQQVRLRRRRQRSPEQKEGKALLQKEFCHFIDETANKDVVDQIMTSLDLDDNGKIDFQEFMSLVTTMAIVCKLQSNECCGTKCPK
ncbi:hypothetical protein INR49_006251 [Caranx melampygus]|nr:hypothetical protein INR49_006251 [Caranx melampygus]